MNNRIKKYVDSIFESLTPSDSLNETKEELILNLSEKYDDLIAEGLGDDLAYKKVIASIGDIDELVQAETAPHHIEQKVEVNILPKQTNGIVLRAIAVVLFIISPTPIIIFDLFAPELESLAIVSFLIIVAIGVGLLMIANQNKSRVTTQSHQTESKQSRTDPKPMPTVFTAKDKRQLKRTNGLIYLIATILFLSGLLSNSFTSIGIFLIAYALTVLIEIIVYTLRLKTLETNETHIDSFTLRNDLFNMGKRILWIFAFYAFLITKWGFIALFIAAACVQVLKIFLDTEGTHEKD